MNHSAYDLVWGFGYGHAGGDLWMVPGGLRVVDTQPALDELREAQLTDPEEEERRA